MEKFGFPRWASITTIFIALIAIVAVVVAFIAPIIISNVNSLIHAIPTIQNDVERIINFSLKQMDKLPSDVTTRINNTVKSLGDGVSDVLANSFKLYYFIYFYYLLVGYGTVLLNLYVKRS